MNGSDILTWEDSYSIWLNEETLDATLKNQIVSLKNNQEDLKEAFYQPMEFGTAGMRGLMGPGINRMNIYTIRQATEGLARFMDTLDDATKMRGVAISYDSRYQSQEFAMESARVLGVHGIPSFVFESLRPTPELSFAVRHLATYAGIMITASHNPKQYNGYKIYGEDGGQMPPEESDMITGFVREADDLFAIKVGDETALKADKMIQIIGEEVDAAYLAEVKKVTINQKLVDEVGSSMKLVFTPLHGTGKMLGERALKQAGFEQFKIVPEQAEGDPEFPTVKLPNPEDAPAFDLAIKWGRREHADLLIAVDPDADRMGVAVRQADGEYKLLTGNQIAVLMFNYILTASEDAGTLPANAVGVKSIVSTELATKIAEAHHAKMINVLTGFKFIAEQIQSYEETNEHTFMFGFEESYGYLIRPFVRDKDAIQALVMLSEVAAYYKQSDKTLSDGLDDLFKEYGYYAENTKALTFEGIEGVQKIKDLMTIFREDAPKDFAGFKVSKLEDFTTGMAQLADGTSEEIGLPTANALKYILEDGSWIAIRPSGTEPKIKFYVGTQAETDEKAQAKCLAFEEAIMAIVNA
ncbi:phosphoglucomutase [Dellaglioa algida DSM 15638]|uniref:Phosphoglucomutase n=1 Tax=Dellaglioa algida DSM 15638 TaxID=1423719 RepID=A0A0R1HII9_9LACO|nr:phosphoglucomutase [Dellaglioa algida DSM 15638]